MRRSSITPLFAALTLLSLIITVTAASPTYRWPSLSCAYRPDAIVHLRQSLTANVIGQEQATESVTVLIQEHLDKEHNSDKHSQANPTLKPLVLSLHGLTGTGKSLTASLIARSLFVNSDAHVHSFHGKRYDSPTSTNRYIHDISTQLLSAITACPLSLFVFEEVHFMNAAVLDALLPYLDYRATVDGHSFSRAVFILTSNYGGQALQKLAFDAEATGVKRQDIAYQTVINTLQMALTKQEPVTEQPVQQQQLVAAAAAAEQQLQTLEFDHSITSDPVADVLSVSSVSPPPQLSYLTRGRLQLLVDHSVVNRFIPFFPLFKLHVKQCVDVQLQYKQQQLIEQQQLLSLHWNDAVLSFLASRVQYRGPVSLYGCKNIADIISIEVNTAISKQQSRAEPQSLPQIQHRQQLTDSRTYRQLWSYMREQVLGLPWTLSQSRLQLDTQQFNITAHQVKQMIVATVKQQSDSNSSSNTGNSVRVKTAAASKRKADL